LGQALTEYLLVFTLVAMVLATALRFWKNPLEKYFSRIAQAIVRLR
jgi:Flp pilus assembly pilin Flp